MHPAQRQRRSYYFDRSRFDPVRSGSLLSETQTDCYPGPAETESVTETSQGQGPGIYFFLADSQARVRVRA